MVNYAGQKKEQEELNKLLQSLLQINGSLNRLDLETNEVYISIPKLDWVYIVRVIEQNKNGNFYKFYSREENENFFKLGGIKVKHC